MLFLTLVLYAPLPLFSYLDVLIQRLREHNAQNESDGEVEVVAVVLPQNDDLVAKDDRHDEQQQNKNGQVPSSRDQQQGMATMIKPALAMKLLQGGGLSAGGGAVRIPLQSVTNRPPTTAASASITKPALPLKKPSLPTFSVTK